MTIRTPLLATLLLLGACDFEAKDIGDPSGETIESSSEASTTGVVTTSNGGSETSNSSSTGGDTSEGSSTGYTSNSSTTGADPSGTTTTATSEPSTTTGPEPSTTGGDTTSNGTEPSTTTSTTGMDATGTGSGGEEPGPVLCDGNPKTFPEFDKQCASVDDCVKVAHTIDCCGSEKLIGINAGALAEFTDAEALCDEQLPQCDCVPNEAVAEDGNSVLNADQASLACTDNQCVTFVF